MALTGNTVQSTYLDLVQLEKSGAGLPSHAGKEAAVYDGSGAQIIGRTAVRHWLDPHPDAASFADTWEFSTTGDMTQGQLETAGWTFSNCTGGISGGTLNLVGTGAAIPQAYRTLTTAMSGDFDISCLFVIDPEDDPGNSAGVWFIGVADTVNDKIAFTSLNLAAGRNQARGGYYTYSTMTGTDLAAGYVYSQMIILRVVRVSGTIFFGGSNPIVSSNFFNGARSISSSGGWFSSGSQADGNTYQRLVIGANNAASKAFSCFFIRRFA